MKVSLGDRIAGCERCGHVEFEPRHSDAALEYLSPLRCSRCDSPTALAWLMLQIGNQAGRRTALSGD